jgi:hypothetical protein
MNTLCADKGGSGFVSCPSKALFNVFEFALKFLFQGSGIGDFFHELLALPSFFSSLMQGRADVATDTPTESDS